MNDETINRGVFMICLLMTIACVLATCSHVRGDDIPKERPHHEVLHNYGLERQQAYMVEGPPTQRMIIGRREIDGYSNHSGTTVWYERNNVVGVTHDE